MCLCEFWGAIDDVLVKFPETSSLYEKKKKTQRQKDQKKTLTPATLQFLQGTFLMEVLTRESIFKCLMQR